VKIKVVKAKSETLALVPVTVHGKEFAFIVDTGAAQTQVTSKAAEELGLAKAGKPKTISGVGCNSKAQPVKIDEWSIGGHSLPTITGDASKPALAKGELAGLLGSDV
jgi:predicted aspartyl protease